MDPKLGRLVTQDEGTAPAKSTWHFYHVVTWQIRKRYISFFTRPMDPKHSRVVTRMRRPHPTCDVTPQSRRQVTTIQ